MRLNDTAEARFWEKVDRSGECWEWTAALTHGYGQFWTGFRNTRAHRVSWAIHNGPIPDGLHVLHRCDNPSCVNPGHLFLGTHRDNVRDAVRKGRHAHGERKGRLSRRDVETIRAEYGEGRKSQYELADEYGVCQAQVSRIVNGEEWNHLPVGDLPDGRVTRGERNPKARLTRADVVQIRRRYASGEGSQREIGEEYGVNQQTVSQIIHGQLWGHVEEGLCTM